MIEPFLQRLHGVGYIDGQNILIEYRFSEDRDDRLPALDAGSPTITLAFARSVPFR